MYRGPNLHRDTIIAMWRSGASLTRIGEQLGLTRNAVSGVVTRWADAAPARKQPYRPGVDARPGL